MENSQPASEQQGVGGALEAESIGEYLARERKLRRVSLDELAQRTRIPRRSLARLESGAFDGQLDGFVRGFVRTVAIDLGLDPDDVLMRMRAEPGTATRRRRPLGTGPRQVLLVLIALVMVAIVGLMSRAVVQRLGSSDAPDRVVVRRDPVRALAEAELDARAALAPRAALASGSAGTASVAAAPD